MRLRSDIWIAALIRRAQSQGAMAALVRRGAAEAGAIFVIVNRLDGSFDLHAPAPQLFYDTDGDTTRRFERVLEAAAESDITQRLEREARMDPDFWVVEIEDRQGRAFLGDA